MTSFRRGAVAAIALASTLTTIPGAFAASCTDAAHPGGDWPSLNHDLHNSRHQTAETTIGPGNVADLEVAFVAQAGESGLFQATPTIANGCLYVASGTTSEGGVFAFNADTGESVWSSPLPGGALGTTVEDGRLFVGSYSSSFDLRAQALDANTGTLLWRTDRLTDEGRRHDGEVIHASPVVFDGMYFVAISRGFGNDSRPPLYFLDVETGEVLKKIQAVGDEEFAQGYTGAGVWSTAAVDTEHKVLYAGTADSESFTSDGRYNNAILKIDADRTSDTFGEIFGSYKGETEHYVDGVNGYDQPACAMFGEEFTGTSPSSSLTCLELDVDFGASINLFHEGDRTIVGAIQKSGVYHAVDAADMTRAWRTVLTSPANYGNAGTSAVDANGVYASANPNVLASLGRGDGLPRWVGSSGIDAIRFQPMTVANGIVYTVTINGMLLALDAATGVPLLQRSMGADLVEGSCTTQGSGVAVARNTVYAQCDTPGAVIAYRLPA